MQPFGIIEGRDVDPIFEVVNGVAELVMSSDRFGLISLVPERATWLHQFLNERLGSIGGHSQIPIHQRPLVQDRLGSV